MDFSKNFPFLVGAKLQDDRRMIRVDDSEIGSARGELHQINANIFANWIRILIVRLLELQIRERIELIHHFVVAKSNGEGCTMLIHSQCCNGRQDLLFLLIRLLIRVRKRDTN